MKPTRPGLLFTGSFLITTSISLLVIYTDFMGFPDSVLEDCMFLGIYPFLPDGPIVGV